MNSSLDAHRKTIGNACFHLNLLNPERRFLRRNLRHILDSHEKLVQRASATEQNATVVKPDNDMNAHDTHFGEYGDLPDDVLKDLTRGKKPLLKIGDLQIRERGIKAKAAWQQREDGWLPSPDVASSIPCIIQVTLSDGTNARQPYHRDSRPATIRQYLHDGRTSHFDVALDQPENPFLIELEKLHTMTESGTSPKGYRWKKTITNKYALEISIQCQNDRDNENLITRLEGKPNYYLKGNESTITATWDQLPACPRPNTLLPLRRSKGHKGRQDVGPYKLGVTMGWARQRDMSLLERWNRARHQTDRSSQQLPTPTASEDSTKVVHQPSVVYIYHENMTTRTKTIKGLVCPLCPSTPEHPSMARLRLHCAMYHDHFQFKPVDETPPNIDDCTGARYTVEIGLGTNTYDLRPPVKLGAHTDADWIAPRHPFNVAAHFRGEETRYLPPLKSKGKAGRGRPAASRLKDSNPASIPQVRPKRPGLEEVKNIPPHKRRKHNVPDVPNVDFFNRISKQRIEPGMSVPDSDEEVDDAWLVERERSGLAEHGRTSVRRDFQLAFRLHMERERPESVLLLKEALVRFVQKHQQDFFTKDQWRYLLRKQLQIYRKDQNLDEETVRFCLKKARAAPQHVVSRSAMVDEILGPFATCAVAQELLAAMPDKLTRTKLEHLRQILEGDPSLGDNLTRLYKRFAESSEAGPGADADGDVDMSGADRAPNGVNGILQGRGRKRRDHGVSVLRDSDEDSDDTPLASRTKGKQKASAPDDSVRKQGLCVCGVPAMGTRAAIACAAPRCVRKDYHLACVGLDKRVPGWRCADCSG